MRGAVRQVGLLSGALARGDGLGRAAMREPPTAWGPWQSTHPRTKVGNPSNVGALKQGSKRTMASRTDERTMVPRTAGLPLQGGALPRASVGWPCCLCRPLRPHRGGERGDGRD